MAARVELLEAFAFELCWKSFSIRWDLYALYVPFFVSGGDFASGNFNFYHFKYHFRVFVSQSDMIRCEYVKFYQQLKVTDAGGFSLAKLSRTDSRRIVRNKTLTRKERKVFRDDHTESEN